MPTKSRFVRVPRSPVPVPPQIRQLWRQGGNASRLAAPQHAAAEERSVLRVACRVVRMHTQGLQVQRPATTPATTTFLLILILPLHLLLLLLLLLRLLLTDLLTEEPRRQESAVRAAVDSAALRIEHLTHRVAAYSTYGCSPQSLRLQHATPTVAASITYGCSLHQLRLQSATPTVAGPRRTSACCSSARRVSAAQSSTSCAPTSPSNASPKSAPGWVTHTGFGRESAVSRGSG